MDDPAEQWRPVPGFAGRYEVSDLGRVRSLARQVRSPLGGTGYRKVPGRLLAVHLAVGAHPFVNLASEGRNSVGMVRSLVMAAFRGPCPRGYKVRNIGDPRDCRLDNLVWVPIKDHHITEPLPTASSWRGNYKRRLTDEQVRYVRQQLADGAGPTSLARELGVTLGVIYGIKDGRTGWHVSKE